MIAAASRNRPPLPRVPILNGIVIVTLPSILSDSASADPSAYPGTRPLTRGSAITTLKRRTSRDSPGVSAVIVVEPVACLKDNYSYLLFEEGGSDAIVVDPSEPAPVTAALAQRKLTLRGILATHHHADHVGGVPALVATAPGPVWVAAHALDRGRIAGQTVFVEAPEQRFVETGLQFANLPLLAMHMPGHTRAAIAWGLPASASAKPASATRASDPSMTDIFTGDTLFAAGCGRLFEGTPAEMLRSLRALTSGPDDVRLWFGHEYTANNLRFAATVDPDNPAIAARVRQLANRTTPTTIRDEKATNPFVRASSVDELAARRAAKDKF
jgi:hydroxyacylglutathione hydrolase